jgi:hypothetical protein
LQITMRMLNKTQTDSKICFNIRDIKACKRAKTQDFHFYRSAAYICIAYGHSWDWPCCREGAVRP